MTLEQIHQRLAQQFGDAVMPFQAPDCGDGCIQVKPESLHAVCQLLRDDPEMQFDFLRLISAVDREDSLSTIYHLYSYGHAHAAVLRVDLATDNPRVASVMDLWRAADWHEREAFDMMGILYEGHEDLRRILLPDDWEGFPLRKNYEPPDEYHGLTNT